MTCKPKICAGDLRHGITIVRRDLLTPEPGSAEPVHAYSAVLTPRAKIETRAGKAEIAQVEINGRRVSHKMTIRWTPVAFDTRDRVRDAAGKLYAILSIENVDERNDWIVLHTARLGDEDVASVR